MYIDGSILNVCVQATFSIPYPVFDPSHPYHHNSVTKFRSIQNY